MKRKTVSKEWGRIMTKPLKNAPRITYKRSRETDWLYKALGWKKDERQSS